MSIKIFSCGDFVNNAGKEDFVDENLKNIISDCDFAICNFEAPIKSESMEPIPKAGPHVFQSVQSVEYLKNVGFSHVSIANNHIYDYGQDALENTIQEFETYKISYVGGGSDFKKAYSPAIIEKNGLRIAILAACENEFGCLYEEQSRGGYAWIFHPIIEDNIRELKQDVDFIIFMAHAGVEDINLPIKEWRDRYKRLCDVGVDVIIGHHPHVPQGYEKYKDSLIFYSLGNFYFDTASFKNKPDDSYSVLLKFEKHGEVCFDIIFHKKINGKTCFTEEKNVDFSIDNLNSLLFNSYLENNNKKCLELYDEYYYGYYKTALNSPIFSKILTLFKKVFFKNHLMHPYLLLLHNIRIESHRFVVQRALSLKYEAKK